MEMAENVTEVLEENITTVSTDTSSAVSGDAEFITLAADLVEITETSTSESSETADLETGLKFLAQKFTKPDPTTFDALTSMSTSSARVILALAGSASSHLLIEWFTPSPATSNHLRLIVVAALLGATGIGIHELLKVLLPNSTVTNSDILTDFFDHWSEHQSQIPSDYLSTLSAAYNAYVANGNVLPFTDAETKNLVNTIKYDVLRRLTTPNSKAFFMKI
jgi:hypothetical protein